jgi:hypothetical protein
VKLTMLTRTPQKSFTYWDISAEGMQNLTLRSTFIATRDLFSCHTLWDTEPWFLMIYPKDHPIQSSLTRTKGCYFKNLFWPGSHGVWRWRNCMLACHHYLFSTQLFMFSKTDVEVSVMAFISNSLGYIESAYAWNWYMYKK